MSNRVDIFRIESAHSYAIIKAEKRTDMLNYVHDPSGKAAGRTYVVEHECILAQHPPPKLTAWEDLLTYDPPPEPEAPRKWLMFAQGDDYLPLGLGGPIDSDARKDMEDTILNSSIQRAIAGASRTDIVPRYTGVATFFIVGVIVALSLLMMLIFIQEYAFNEPAPPAQTETIDGLPSSQLGDGNEVN